MVSQIEHSHMYARMLVQGQ